VTPAIARNSLPRDERGFSGFLNGDVLNELQELITNPDETDDLLRLACTGCRSANSRSAAASPPSWPLMTAPPSSNAASTSS
jgi:hypothetical protein